MVSVLSCFRYKYNLVILLCRFFIICSFFYLFIYIANIHSNRHSNQHQLFRNNTENRVVVHHPSSHRLQFQTRHQKNQLLLQRIRDVCLQVATPGSLKSPVFSNVSNSNNNLSSHLLTDDDNNNQTQSLISSGIFVYLFNLNIKETSRRYRCNELL
jgi:hypothetical protein